MKIECDDEDDEAFCSICGAVWENSYGPDGHRSVTPVCSECGAGEEDEYNFSGACNEDNYGEESGA